MQHRADRQPHRSLRYRPALDGIRGVAVLAVVVYHLNNRWLPGGWLGVDVFFVLSGFLICSLLLAEYRRRQSIDLIGFWLARARRLLPGLLLVVAAVLVLSRLWAEPSRRVPIAWDGLATVLYVSNWRLLLSDDAYFGSTLGMPSPLRHTWSLAIEEQFYLVFPLLLVAILAVTWRLSPRRPRLPATAVFVVLATASAVWMAVQYVPGTEPTRVYYSTATRAFELLIGAVAGIWWGPHEFGRRSGASTMPRRVDPWLGRIGILAAILVLSAFALADETATWIFRGGLVLLCLLIVFPVSAGAAVLSTPIQRALAFEPLRWLGTVSYSLYLWHWPVIVFLTRDRLGLPPLVVAIIQFSLSLAIAYCSYRFIEQPIRKGGLRALVPAQPQIGRVIAWCSVPALAIGMVALGRSSSDALAVSGPQITYTKPAPPASGPPVRVSVIGNSVPYSLYVYFPAGQIPTLTVQAVSNFGCEPWAGKRIIDGSVQPALAECPQWQNTWPDQLAAQNPQTVIYPVSQAFVNDFQVDGHPVDFGTPAHDAFIKSSLDHVASGAAHAGAHRFVLLNLSCHRMPNASGNSELTAVNDDAKVQHVNSVAATWARQHDVQVLDLYTFLCSDGYRDVINGQPLWQDGLHFTAQSAPIVWRWIANQL
ncbi:peptidoglycan/LPS O-acetylase OafA/YrhL [Branchiibius hedensis]|uniref:Acyltransferase family protein n=1 Tax=Branchiibius hedensis TaxID=672460 RepID=A0A2Y8ZW32_9MICO|nr:peptidoglycan/LPS O-acetylase OafA/YrhL [Branchiibius hedensis]SSA34097.1 Acyltransferase family protein [Branchiibius hedensis]